MRASEKDLPVTVLPKKNNAHMVSGCSPAIWIHAWHQMNPGFIHKFFDVSVVSQVLFAQVVGQM